MMLFIMRELRLGIESFVGKALALDEGNDPERFGTQCLSSKVVPGLD